ncbi:MAG: 23S rRNA (pseudouridine(1915)-N(3))-methyltransferase RlmH [Lachnospiraceae bacterium]|nr:23S rRNA (pseudouridine(1915)-N(3))-methyltransferase RlmH [Lachnospiraceae bacterium]
MQIKLLTVGKIKEAYFRDAVGEYEKRLSRYCKLSVLEVKDEKAPENLSEKEMEQIKDAEGSKLLEKIGPDDHVIALAIGGKKYTSEEFSSHMEQVYMRSKGAVCFVIGGSLGLSGEVLRRSNEQLSFSDMTFPHQLMRVVFLEQLYRAFRIKTGEPYHK